MTKPTDLIGQVFTRLTVVSRSYPNTPAGKARWVCQCSCGGTTVVTAGALQTGHISSCGCLKRELISKANTTHGLSNLPEYEVWKAMWQRCENPRNKRFPSYWERRPPEEWKDFTVFFKELGPRPSPKHSLERIENSKPYGPGNCEWATTRQQARNRGKFILRVSLEGKEMSFTEACERTGLNTAAAFQRWYRTKDMEKVSFGKFKLA